jgi:ribosomal protein S18 acetylase RimI-like enzyme
MPRRLRPLAQDHLDRLPCPTGGCIFWESPEKLELACGAASDHAYARDWFERVSSEWGECGRVAADEDGEILGFIKYAPSSYFPQAAQLPIPPPPPGGVLISCIHIRDDARSLGLGRLLLFAALKDLAQRGEKMVWAYGYTAHVDLSKMPMIGVEFLLRHGFTVTSPHPIHPLLQMDVRSLVSWTENLDSMLQALRIPVGRTRRVPSPSIDA